MVIYSDKTHKQYNTVDECLEAEKAFDEEVRAKEVEKKRLAGEKDARLKEVNDAMQKAQELADKYCDDYGFYSFQFSNSNSNLMKWFLRNF